MYSIIVSTGEHVNRMHVYHNWTQIMESKPNCGGILPYFASVWISPGFCFIINALHDHEIYVYQSKKA